ncbi:hypothetical protein WJX84_000027 [Apatococcus fuscideae]|uniref:Uncharacterized protein n=1 Tax=Apatococcus fuscideae TaxID=2026836 RepID=A0AAW1SMG6_9CHLO
MADFSSLFANMPGVQIQRCQSGQVAIDSFGAIDLQHESLRLSNAGRHEEAKAKAQSSLETRLKIKGPKSLDVGVALQRLAEVEGDLGNHQEALELAKRAMMVREGLRGEQLDAAVSRDEAARNLEALGRMHEAGEFRKAGQLPPEQQLQTQLAFYRARIPSIN